MDRWAEAHGFRPEEVVAKAQGRPSITTVREYLPHADHEAENRIVELSEMEDLEGVVSLPGARELLDHLPGDGWTIVTSSTRPLAEVRLRAAGLAIPEKLITSSDIVNGKPHPEPYLKAARMLGYAAGECVVVEDVPAGIEAGRAAGAKVIAFPTTCDMASLTAAGPDWIVENYKAISVSRVDAELHVELSGELIDKNTGFHNPR